MTRYINEGKRMSKVGVKNECLGRKLAKNYGLYEDLISLGYNLFHMDRY